MDVKAELHRYLTAAREAVLWKLEGVCDYDARRPMTGTGTSLVGLVKHLAGVEVGYFGESFGRPFPQPLPWNTDAALEADPNADLWATTEQSREQMVTLYRRAVAHSDETIEALAADAPGRVRWWPAERADVTLAQVMIHMLAETNRHAGHLDILRETVDGGVGLRAERDNMPGAGTDWAAHVARVEHSARAGARDGSAPRA